MMPTNKINKHTNRQNTAITGFTLIELLVTIAIIGVLAGITFVAINPNQSMNRARDINGINAVEQCTNALETWHVRHDPNYPASLNDLIADSDLKVIPNGCRYYTRTADGNNAWIASDILADPQSYGCPEASTRTHYCYQTLTGEFGYICEEGDVFAEDLSNEESCEDIADRAINGIWITR